MFSWGSIYYLHHYNPSKESPGPLGDPFLECCKRSNWKNHSWELGMGAYLLKQMAPGSRDLVGVRGEGVGGGVAEGLSACCTRSSGPSEHLSSPWSRPHYAHPLVREGSQGHTLGSVCVPASPGRDTFCTQLIFHICVCHGKVAAGSRDQDGPVRVPVRFLRAGARAQQ